MRAWHIVRSRFRSLVFRGGRESDLNEELQFHLERETERLQASGLSREDARLQALRLFGGVEQIKEASRDARGTAAFDALARDTRYAVRRLVRDWRFTTAAVLILGLAIGANTAIFSVVNAVLFRDSPVADAERLVNIYQNDPAGKPLVVVSYDSYKELAQYADIFAATMAATIPFPARYLHEGGIRNGTAEYATATYLDVLGLRPSLGRWFDATEERPGAPLVAVLGYQAWTSEFRADPSILGRIVRIEGAPVTIVGIGPANHRGTLDVGLVTDFWLPVTALRELDVIPWMPAGPTIIAPFFVKARLREGATVAQAKAAMDVLAPRLAAALPEEVRGGGEFVMGTGITVVATTDVRVHPQADAPFMAIASGVLVVVGLVLAIACSNLATLLLVRGAARTKEISVRLAMGATRRQLVRHLLTESLLLSLAGGIAGCILAWWTLRALQGVELPVTVDLTVDYRVLAFAMALSLVTGVAFGLMPALKATRVDLLPALRDEGVPPIDHRRLTLKNALIVVQVAVSVLLLGGTSIFLQQLAATRERRVGYAVDGVAMLETDARFSVSMGYPAAAAVNLYDELLRRIAAVPGVQSAALSYGLPMESATVATVVEGAASDARPTGNSSMIWAGPGFFETLRIPLLHGRVFDARDRAGTPSVAVVTETMARRYFGMVDAVGRRFRNGNQPNSWMEVIGVVRDTGTRSLSPDDVLARQPPQFYRSYAQGQEKSRYGDKTPLYMQHLDVLPRAFPDARYVHIVRDGRDAALSMLAMRRKPRFNLSRPRRVGDFACAWQREIRDAQRFGLAHAYSELRYEDLVVEPEARLRDVCDFLGLGFEPGMLQYHRREDPALYADHPRLAQPPVRDARSWRKEMHDEDAELFEAIAGDLLTELGYDRAHPSPGRSARAAAERAAYSARLGVWRTALPLVRKSPAWRLRQVYIRRG